MVASWSYNVRHYNMVHHLGEFAPEPTEEPLEPTETQPKDAPRRDTSHRKLPLQDLCALDAFRSCGLLDASTLELGLYTPHDGDICPNLLTYALAKEAKAAGARIVFDAEVASLAQVAYVEQTLPMLEAEELLCVQRLQNSRCARASGWGPRSTQTCLHPELSITLAYQTPS